MPTRPLSAEEEQDTEKRLCAVTIMALKRFANAELATFHCAASFLGQVPPENLAYQKAVDAALIRKDGSVMALDITIKACAHEVKRRMDAGTFN